MRERIAGMGPFHVHRREYFPELGLYDYRFRSIIRRSAASSKAIRPASMRRCESSSAYCGGPIR